RSNAVAHSLPNHFQTAHFLKAESLRPVRCSFQTPRTTPELRKGGGWLTASFLPKPYCYCNSFSTSCCCWFAWARAETPVCSRMEYWVNLATVVGMSAAVTSFSAEVRFWTWLLMTLEALCKRLTVAPILPRSP